MNWLDNVCVKKPHNCLKQDKCPIESECCYEKNSKIGVCVAKGSCNWETGHPTKTPEKGCPSSYMEGYDSTGDICNCDNWKWAMMIMVIIALMFGGGFLYLGFMYKK